MNFFNGVASWANTAEKDRKAAARSPPKRAAKRPSGEARRVLLYIATGQALDEADSGRLRITRCASRCGSGQAATSVPKIKTIPPNQTQFTNGLWYMRKVAAWDEMGCQSTSRM